MKLGVSFGGAGVKDGQYAYIQVFIDYLKEIIGIIKDLFSLVKKDDTTTAASEEGSSSEAANG